MARGQLESYLLMLEDQRLRAIAIERCAKHGIGAGLKQVAREYAVATYVAGAGDPLLEQRAIEVENLCLLLATSAAGLPLPSAGEVLVVAERLTAVTALAVVGGRAAAVVASGALPDDALGVAICRAAAIPVLADIAGLFAWVRPDDTLLVDCTAGLAAREPAGDDDRALSPREGVRAAAGVKRRVDHGGAQEISTLNCKRCKRCATIQTRRMRAPSCSARSKLESSALAAVAANIIANAGLRGFEGALVAAFDRFMQEPDKTDKGCTAKTCDRARAVSHRGRLRRRCSCAASGTCSSSRSGAASRTWPWNCARRLRSRLVQNDHPQVMIELARLLADGEAGARTGAAQALGVTRHRDAAVALLRFKILIGDADVARDRRLPVELARGRPRGFAAVRRRVARCGRR